MVAIDFEALVPSLTAQIKVVQQLKVFDDNEIKAIKNHRKFYEKLLTRENTTCEDILQYVRYELDLLAVVREKKVEEAMVKTKNTVIYSSGNLLNRLFKTLVANYPDQIKFFVLYITFCREMKDSVSLLRVVESLLRIHKDKPIAYIIASRIAREELNNLSQAREYLWSGIRAHIDSQELYKEAFLMELAVCRMKYENSEDKNELIKNPDFRRALEYVYDAARTKIHSAESSVPCPVHFFVDLFYSVKGLPYAVPLESKIRDDLRKRFPKEEITWETLACVKSEELQVTGKEPNYYKTTIEELIDIYKTAVGEHLNTQSMWSLYIDRMLLIQKDKADILPNFRKNCVIKALMAAHAEKQLTEKYYLIWCELQKDEERKLKLLEIAAGMLPTSATLWVKIISSKLSVGDELGAWKYFKDSLSHCKKNPQASMTIWTFMLRYYQCVKPEIVDKLFREAVTETSGVAVQMKPLYLEWTTLSKGMLHGRELYKEIGTVPPYSMALHDKMLELENYQVKLNVRALRMCHMLSTEQFGSNDTAVWMRWIRFEYSIGKPKDNIANIRDQAENLLQPALLDEFTAEMRLFEIECLSSWKKKAEAKSVKKMLTRKTIGAETRSCV